MVEIRNSFWILLDKVSALISTIVVFIVLARLMPISDVGDFTYAQSISSILLIVATLGINVSSLPIFSGLDKKRCSNLIKTVVFVQLIVSVFIVLTLYIKFVSINLIFILTLQSFFKVSDVYRSFFDSRMDSKSYAKGLTILHLFSSLLKVVVIAFTHDVRYLCFLYVFESFLTLILFIFIFEKYEDLKFERKDKSNILELKEHFKSIFENGLPALMTSVLFVAYQRLDQYMIYNMLGSASQALYSSAVKISEGWYFIPASIVTSYYVSMAKSKKDEDKYYNVIHEVSRKVNVVTIPIAMFVYIFSVEILTLLYGNDYSEASGVLSILMFNGVVIALSSITFRHLIIIEKKYITILRAILGLLLNVVLNYIFIPMYGIVGSAYASLISMSMSLFFSNLMFSSTRPIFFIQFKALFFRRRF